MAAERKRLVGHCRFYPRVTDGFCNSVLQMVIMICCAGNRVAIMCMRQALCS